MKVELFSIYQDSNYKSRNDLKLYKNKNLEFVFIKVLSKSDKNTVTGCIYIHPNLAIFKNHEIDFSRKIVPAKHMITGNANKHFAFKLILNSELLQNNTCNGAMSITINPVSNCFYSKHTPSLDPLPPHTLLYVFIRF